MPVWLLTTINKPNDEINGQLWAKKGTDVEFFVNYIPAGRPDLPVICFPHPKAQYSYWTLSGMAVSSVIRKVADMYEWAIIDDK